MRSPLHKFKQDIIRMRESGQTYQDIQLALMEEVGLSYSLSNLRSFWMRHIKPEINMQDVI